MDLDGFVGHEATMNVEERGEVQVPRVTASSVEAVDNSHGQLDGQAKLKVSQSKVSPVGSLANLAQENVSTHLVEHSTKSMDNQDASTITSEVDQPPGFNSVSSMTEVQQPADQEGLEDYGDEDGGVIRCICECDDDDGFTIQCDRCLVWQHCACFGMSQASVPEEYHCEQCNPRPVDVDFAKAHQQKRREAEVRKASMERNMRRHTQVGNAAAIAAAAAAAATTASQHPSAAGLDISRNGMGLLEDDSIEFPKKGQQSGSGGISRSRKPSQQLDLTNVNNFSSVDGPPSSTATPGSARSYRKRGGGPKGGARKTPMTESPVHTSLTPRTAAMMSSMASNPQGSSTSAIGRSEDRLETEESSAEKTEAWQVEYTPSNRNIIAEESVLNSLQSISLDYAGGSPIKAEPGSGNRLVAPVLGRKVKVLANLNLSTGLVNSKNVEGEGVASTTTMDIGLVPIGKECIPVEMKISSLADCTQKTYVKQISEWASASIFNSLLHITTLPNEPQRPWSASRAFSKPIMHGLFADVSIPAGAFITEYVGEIYSADSYRRDPINQYQSIGTSKPGVHLFPPPLGLCIDARKFGNTSRFARFSCHPNAVLRPIVFTLKDRHSTDLEGQTTLGKSSSPDFETQQQAKEKQVLFGIFAINDIPRSHEITLGWEWDDAHIIHLLPQLVQNPLLGIMDPLRSSKSASTGNQRVLEREKRNAAIAVLVEKGDFPYAGMAFCQKMNYILTVLLSSCLCACIGSASAPSSHGTGVGSNGSISTASSNNVKRQDCAIAQMLRLSQGMSLLNVYVPGSNPNSRSNRKIKAPDFEPLLGKRRWWRPDAMPLTPSSSNEDDEKALGKEDDLYRQLDVRYKLCPGGRVGRVQDGDFEEALEKGKLDTLQRKDESLEIYEDDEEGVESDVESHHSEDSTLTVPLVRDSEQYDDDDEDEEDDSVILDGKNISIFREEGGASYLTRTALPPKKRVSGTRLKAVNSEENNSDIEYKGRKRRKGPGTKEDNTNSSRAKKRSGIAKVARLREDHGSQSRKESRTSRKKKRKANEASSPLTSAPSSKGDESDDSEESLDDSRASQQQIIQSPSLTKKGFRVEGSSNAESKRRKMTNPEAKKNLSLAKKRRQELLGDLDEDSEGSSEMEKDRDEAQDFVKTRPRSSSLLKKQTKKKVMKLIMESEESGGTEDEERQSEDVKMQLSIVAEPVIDEQIAITDTMMEATAVSTEAEAAPPPPPPPMIEVPKAKLSLAEYKKRLAERRTTSMNSQSNTTTPLSTPNLIVPSPEKASLPNTPSSATPNQSAFTFPVPGISAIPESIVTTTSPIKAEFAPPAPRFPRPTTPPREADVPTKVSSIEAAPLTEAVPQDSQRAPLAITDYVLPAVNSIYKDANSTESTFSTTPQQEILSPTTTQRFNKPIAEATAASASSVESTTRLGFAPVAQDLGNKEVKTTFPSTLTDGHTVTKVSVSAPGLSNTGITSIATAATATPPSFNPPKAPRALINSSFSAPAPVVSAPVVSAPVVASSPPLVPARSTSIVAPISASSLSEPAIQRQTANPNPGYDAIPSPLSLQDPSPTRHKSAIISPAISASSPYITSSTAAPIGTPSALKDFANVPKGPARMRERERDRDVIRDRERDRIMEEREFREPIPPSREYISPSREYWQRERDWDRERERDVDRDSRESFYTRDRSHSFERRRLEEEEDRLEFAPNRSVPPFLPRGGSRGGFAGRGISTWAGRARTRGRGSRGGWR